MWATKWTRRSGDALFWDRPAFMFGVPLFFAVIFGFYRVNLPQDYALPAAIFVRWVALQSTWIGFEICSQVLIRIFRPTSRAGVWGTLALGGLLGAIFMQPVRGLFLTLWATHVAPMPVGAAFPRFDTVIEFLYFHGGFAAVPVALWLATHAYFWEALSAKPAIERASGTAPVDAVEPPPQHVLHPLPHKPVNMTQAAYGWPEFIRPTLTKIGADIIAFHSEDHYVRVVSSRGSDLLRYRFKDAIRELRPLGFCQIHRTSAVNLAAIVDCNTSVHAAYVTLRRGEQHSVSRSFRIPLMEALRSYQADQAAQAAE